MKVMKEMCRNRSVRVLQLLAAAAAPARRARPATTRFKRIEFFMLICYGHEDGAYVRLIRSSGMPARRVHRTIQTN